MNADPNSSPSENAIGRSWSFYDELTWHSVFRWVLAGNPFYPISAALMLYAIYRLSIDPAFFSRETLQLFFNFSSLQLYELLVAGTALFLARRRIGYDATLLTALENMLVLVAFILISHAVFLSQTTAALLCVAGAALAALRFGAIKRFFPELNFPHRLLGFGAVFLAVNVFFPFLFRRGLETHNESWATPNAVSWLVVLPFLLSLANLLPAPSRANASVPQRPWLPLGVMITWTLATGIHLWSIAYVDDRTMRIAWLAPGISVLAWTLWHRIHDFTESVTEQGQIVLCIVPAAVPLLALEFTRSGIALILFALHAATYAALYFFHRRPETLLHGLLASLAGLIAAWPVEWARELIPGCGRWSLIGIGAFAFGVALSLRSRSLSEALLGAISVAGVVCIIFRQSEVLEHLILQASAVYLLLHSLFWEDAAKAGTSWMRNGVALIWATHALAWTYFGTSPVPTGLLPGFASAVIAGILIQRILAGHWGPLLLPAASVFVLLAKPMQWAVDHAKETPTGVVLLLASLLVFGIGTAAALWRQRGEAQQSHSPVIAAPRADA
jgi:hypothetical protein